MLVEAVNAGAGAGARGGMPGGFEDAQEEEDEEAHLPEGMVEVNFNPPAAAVPAQRQAAAAPPVEVRGAADLDWEDAEGGEDDEEEDEEEYISVRFLIS